MLNNFCALLGQTEMMAQMMMEASWLAAKE